MAEKTIIRLAIDQIRIENAIQSRVETDPAVVAEYAEILTDQPDFDFLPIDVFDDGEILRVVDGIHRFLAYGTAQRETIPCRVHKGTKSDAVKHAAGANASHGLRRTNADKRNAVMMMLKDEEWERLSDNAIAKHCGVSQPFVSGLRKGDITVISEGPISSDKPERVRITDANTKGLGKSETPDEHPCKPIMDATARVCEVPDMDNEVMSEADLFREIQRKCDALFPLARKLKKDPLTLHSFDSQLKRIQDLIAEYRERHCASETAN